MNGATVQANVLVALPLNRLRVLVYCTVAVTVVLTAAAGFLVYERVSKCLGVYIISFYIQCNLQFETNLRKTSLVTA